MVLEPKRRRFTVDEYYEMARAGILRENDRVELIEGEIIELTPIGRLHAACVDRLTESFVRTFSDVAVVRVRNPVRLSSQSEPQPDLALLRRKPDFYASGHPGAGDTILLVEVAATSLETDHRMKVPLYARSGVAEVWVVDLERRAVTIHRDPSPDGYRTVRVARPGELISLDAYPDRSLAIEDLLVA